MLMILVYFVVANLYYHLDIYVDGHSLECVDTQKYLDLHIDYKLSWRSRVASICKKMAYYLAIFDWMLPKYFI